MVLRRCGAGCAGAARVAVLGAELADLIMAENFFCCCTSESDCCTIMYRYQQKAPIARISPPSAHQCSVFDTSALSLGEAGRVPYWKAGPWMTR